MGSHRISQKFYAKNYNSEKWRYIRISTDKELLEWEW